MHSDIPPAHVQGWFYSEIFSRILRSVISNNLYTPQFETDDEARAFVEQNALKGDPLCIKVLKIMMVKRLRS